MRHVEELDDAECCARAGQRPRLACGRSRVLPSNVETRTQETVTCRDTRTGADSCLDDARWRLGRSTRWRLKASGHGRLRRLLGVGACVGYWEKADVVNFFLLQSSGELIEMNDGLYEGYEFSFCKMRKN